MKLELCTDSIEHAAQAVECGMHRIELCANLLEGGTTPSVGMIEQTVLRSGVDVYPLIRPRPGNFVYDEWECRAMVKDIAVAHQAGATGVVIGVLTKDNNLHQLQLMQLMEEARKYDLDVTFHRAFDAVAEPFSALEHLMAAGVNRILTSGQQNTAREGIDLIRQLIRAADGKLSIMPGSGVGPGNAKALAEAGAVELHFTARKLLDSEALNMGQSFVFDADKVRGVQEQLNILSS